jgi:hypothetical protein
MVDRVAAGPSRHQCRGGVRHENTRSAHMNAEFVEPHRPTRVIFLVAMGALGLGVLLAILERLLPPDTAADPVASFKVAHNRLFITTVTMVPLLVGVSLACLWLAIRVKRSGQWPPPGMRVPVRMPIRRGRRATLQSVLFFVLAGSLMLLAVGSVCTWHWVSRVARDLDLLR